MQEKVRAFKEVLRDTDKGSGDRPRIKGRSGKQAELLRNWLGEYLVAKYEEIVQLQLADKKKLLR